MRRILILLLLAVAAPMATGQSDARGDHEAAVATASGTGWTPIGPTGGYNDMDLLEAGLRSDNASTIVFAISPATTQPGQDPLRDDMTLRAWFYFSIDSNDYRIHLWEEGEPVPWLAELQRMYDGEPFTLGSVAVQATEGEFLLAVPRDALRDAEGNIPGIGQPIERMRIALLGEHIRGLQCPDDEPAAVCSLKVRDFLPDQGVLDPVTLSSDPGQMHGHLQVANPSPVRSSNGAATTYIFEARIKNTATEADTLQFAVANQPAHWTVQAPERLTFQPGESLRYAVAVSVPFNHEHGKTEAVEIKLESQLNKAVAGTIQFAVDWIHPAQPAGHHHTLYLHFGSSEGSNGLYLDTRQLEESTTSNLFTYTKREGGEVHVESSRKDIPLLPALLLGLDADPTREGVATIVLESSGSGNHDVEAVFTYHPNPQEPDPQPRMLFQVPQTPIELQSGRNELVLPLRVLDPADYVPLSQPGRFTLDIYVNKTHPEPSYAPGAGSLAEFQIVTEETHFQFPLFEYHDPVPQDEAAIELRALTPLELRRAPGATAVFQWEVNAVASGLSVVASPGFTAQILNHDGQTLVEAFHVVHEDAIDGQNIDGLITVTDNQQATQTFAVARVIVDSNAKEDDIPSVAGPGRASSMVGSGLVLACLGMTVLGHVLRRGP